MTFRVAIENHLKYSLGKDGAHASLYDWRMSLSLAIRDRIVDPWFASTKRTYELQKKRGLLPVDGVPDRVACWKMRWSICGWKMWLVRPWPPSASISTRSSAMSRMRHLAMADWVGWLPAIWIPLSTLGCPAYGYGIRYEHGLFRQSFEDGRQVETAEAWLAQRNPWEFERPEARYEIGFGGSVAYENDTVNWTPEESVIASGYDTPIIGWQGSWGQHLAPVVGQTDQTVRPANVQPG